MPWIGGASMYRQFLPLADRMLITEIHASSPADVYFPTFNKDEWNIETLSSHESSDGIKYKHRKYTR